jgi:hypothetical protein
MTDLNIAGVGPGHRVLRRRRFLESTIPTEPTVDRAVDLEVVVIDPDSIPQAAEQLAGRAPRSSRRGGRVRPGRPDDPSDGGRAA